MLAINQAARKLAITYWPTNSLIKMVRLTDNPQIIGGFIPWKPWRFAPEKLDAGLGMFLSL